MKNNYRYLAILACLILIITAASVFTKYQIYQATDYEYYQVFLLNRDYKEEHKAAHILLPIEDHDWEETANALGIPVDSLSIATYLDYISK